MEGTDRLATTPTPPSLAGRAGDRGRAPRQEGRAVEACVIGAGVAGLAAAKQLHEAGIAFEAFDARERVGGIWAYSEQPGSTSVWHSLNMNSPRGTYEFSDHPMPDHYPDFPRHSQVLEYLESYVDRFGFRDRIQLGATVQRVAPAEDGGWLVSTGSGRTRRYDAVVVANGHHNEPHLPQVEGRFTGGSIHSRDYRRREGYAGKRVLVVGYGNSGSQIAVDVSHVAEETYLSARRGFYLFPHYHRGRRIDRLFDPKPNLLLERCLPRRWRGQLMTRYYQGVLGRVESLGLPKPDHFFGESFPTISESLANRIGDGRIRIKPGLRRFDGTRVIFADGSEVTVDEVIHCTGYRTVFPFLDESVFAAPDNRVGLYQRIFHPAHAGLCFVGAFQAMAWGFLPLMEAQARLVAAYLGGGYALPAAEAMRAEIAREEQRIARAFVRSPRHHYQVNGHSYMRALELEMARGRRRARRAPPAALPGAPLRAAPGL